jgi:hypothetical protein
MSESPCAPQSQSTSIRRDVLIIVEGYGQKVRAGEASLLSDAVPGRRDGFWSMYDAGHGLFARSTVASVVPALMRVDSCWAMPRSEALRRNSSLRYAIHRQVIAACVLSIGIFVEVNSHQGHNEGPPRQPGTYLFVAPT